MKNNFKIAILTITLSAFTAQSSAIIEENYSEKSPKMVANTMEGISQEDLGEEMKALNRGIKDFSVGKFFNALDHFKKALGDYGSPLGFFYASFLEIDRETKRRYLAIARNAENYGALPKGTLQTHNTWVKRFLKAQGGKSN